MERLTLVTGPFKHTLEEVLRERGPFDVVFVDGNHDEFATQTYWRQIAQHMAGHRVVIFDDIRWSSGMKRAWDAIRSSELVKISLDLRQMGIVVLDPAIEKRRDFRIWLV